MKILIANKFFYKKGGAELVALGTAELLTERGHELSFFAMEHPRNEASNFSRYFVSNVDYEKPSLGGTIKAAGRLLYSWEARRSMADLIKDHRPDLAHLHNIYHQISPSILHALKKDRIPVVMTLHDYKVVCGSYSMILNGRSCEACRGGRHYQCLLKKCVKGSRVKSALNTLEMYLHHQILRIYDHVDVFISPSRFLRDKVSDMGFKGDIECLSNFVHVDQFKPRYGVTDPVFCYIGRLSKEKGVQTLVKAVKGLKGTLKLIGEGPLRSELEAYVKTEGMTNVIFAGYKSGDDLKEEIASSMFTVLPSECYENNPLSVMEAFALGKPVIGARTGGIPELVQDGRTGYTFTAFDGNDLRIKIDQLINDPAGIERMGRQARQFVEQELTPDKHYEKLMKIYEKAIAKAKK